MEVVVDDVFELFAGEVVLFAGEIDFGELHFGAGIGMIFDDVFPDLEGIVGLVEGHEGFGIGHEGVAEIVLGIFAADGVEQGAGFGGALEAEETLAEMRAGVDVVGVAL